MLPAGLAQADTAAVTSNQVSFNVPGGFSYTATVGSNGVLTSNVADVPASSINTANGLNVTWAISATSDAVTDGTYTFTVGFFIDQDGSARRLEIVIPNVQLTFSGGNLTGGSVGTNTGTKVYGRAADNVTIVQTTILNSSFTINNNSLSLNLGNQLTKIAAGGTILNDLINTFTTTPSGHYNFGVLLKQTSTTATGKILNFGLTSGTKFPCVESDVSLITGNNEDFTGASAIQGQFNISGVGGSSTDDVTAFGGTCAASATPTTTTTTTTTTTPTGDESTTTTTTTTGGKSTTTTTTTQAAAENLLSQATESPDTVTDEQANNLLTGATTDAANLAADPTASTEQLTGALETLATSTQVGELVEGSDPAVAVAAVDAAVEVITRIDSGSLTTTQREELETNAQTIISSIGGNVSSTATLEETEKALEQAANVVQALAAAGSALSAETVAAVQQTIVKVEAAVIAAANNKPSVKSLGEFATPQAFVANRLAARLIPKSSLAFSNTSLSRLESFRLLILGQQASSSSTLTRAFNPAKTPEQIIETAIGGDAKVVDNAQLNRTDVTVNGLYYPTEVIDIAIVANLATGASDSSEGGVLLISDDLAFNLAPSAKDLASFSDALMENFSATVTRNTASGSLLLENSDVKVSMTFAFEDASGTGSNPGQVSFAGPTGDPADPGYKYSVTYADGATQSMLPYVADSNFLDSLDNVGFLGAIDRSTGIITLSNGLQVKPDFFVRPLSASAQVFLKSSGVDSNGVGFSAIGDVNGDGIDDYEIISAVGQQTLYGVAP